MIKSSGYAHTLVVWGLIQGAIGILAAQWLRMPPHAQQATPVVPASAAPQSRRSFSPRQMLANPIFYLLFVMMSMMSTSGLMVVSNVGPFAKDFGVANVPVLGMAALPLSLTLSRFTNGLTRPFFGWVSDHIGREATMALAFSLEALAIVILFAYINQPAMFVVLTGLVFFGWGEIFSLFPATLTDTFGPKYAATNYGFLYIAQGVGSILGGPAAAFLKDITGGWVAVFAAVAALDVLTALLAITVLRSSDEPAQYLASRFDSGAVCPYIRRAARARGPAPCFATRGFAGRRFGAKPVGPAAGLIVSAAWDRGGRDPQRFLKVQSEDANDQAPRGEVQDRPADGRKHLGPAEKSDQQARIRPRPARAAAQGQAVGLRRAIARQAEAQRLLRQHVGAAFPRHLR
jgi:MFS family permease